MLAKERLKLLDELISEKELAIERASFPDSDVVKSWENSLRRLRYWQIELIKEVYNF